MRRIHIALAVGSIADSVEDYSVRIGTPPTVVVGGKYALWRTDQMNFSINEIPERTGELRHLGFEDDAVEGFSSDSDVNNLVWELFSPTAQDEKIREIYGEPTG
ncbi:MAG: hypothetical protein ACI915_003187 [Gammaproteobacteria bacterium]|jgi:hypothetical protein